MVPHEFWFIFFSDIRLEPLADFNFKTCHVPVNRCSNGPKQMEDTSAIIAPLLYHNDRAVESGNFDWGATHQSRHIVR